MIVGTKRDMVMCPESLALVNECGFDYIGSLCAKVDISFMSLPVTDIGDFSAKKLGNVYCIHFGHTFDEPYWARCEKDIRNLDIFVKKESKMKKKHIDVDALPMWDELFMKGKNDSGVWVRYRDVENMLKNAPAADVEEVRHGEWIFGITMNHEWMKCSECLVSQTPTGVFAYCPNCGAKMDRKESNG